MIQTILTGIIVLTAFIVTIVHIARFFTSPAGKCKGCSHYNTSCSLEEFKAQIEKKNKEVGSNGI